jgi:hypothetical protein
MAIFSYNFSVSCSIVEAVLNLGRTKDQGIHSHCNSAGRKLAAVCLKHSRTGERRPEMVTGNNSRTGNLRLNTTAVEFRRAVKKPTVVLVMRCMFCSHWK